MKTEEGIVAMLHSSATQWRHRFQLEITLTKGQIILDGILSSSKSYGAETMTVAYASNDHAGDPVEKKPSITTTLHGRTRSMILRMHFAESRNL